MTTQITKTSIAGTREHVIALHCSGGSPKQWRSLTDAASWFFEVSTPTNSSCARTQPGAGAPAFSLAEEAAQTIDLIEKSAAPVHLVGHSFGGAVALYVAAIMPEKIASLSLYEPAAFHLLKQADVVAREALKEIDCIHTEVRDDLTDGHLSNAARRFVEFWNGFGSWSELPEKIKKLLGHWVQYCPQEFSACIDHDTPLNRYARLAMPVLLLRGEHARTSINAVIDTLDETLPNSRTTQIRGAGHMGPITHAHQVTAYIANFIFDVAEMRSEQQLKATG